MSEQTENLVKDLHLMARNIYLACDESVADDISPRMTDAVNVIRRLERERDEAVKETEKLRADIQYMVEKAAAKELPAYREQGEEMARLHQERDELAARCERLTLALAEIDSVSIIPPLTTPQGQQLIMRADHARRAAGAHWRKVYAEVEARAVEKAISACREDSPKWLCYASKLQEYAERLRQQVGGCDEDLD